MVQGPLDDRAVKFSFEGSADSLEDHGTEAGQVRLLPDDECAVSCNDQDIAILHSSEPTKKTT